MTTVAAPCRRPDRAALLVRRRLVARSFAPLVEPLAIVGRDRRSRFLARAPSALPCARSPRRALTPRPAAFLPDGVECACLRFASALLGRRRLVLRVALLITPSIAPTRSSVRPSSARRWTTTAMDASSSIRSRWAARTGGCLVVARTGSQAHARCLRSSPGAGDFCIWT
jgi:hypothetical protein